MCENNYNENMKNTFIYKIGKFIKFEKEQKEYDVIDDYIYNRGNNAIRKRKKLSKCKRRS